MFGQNPTIRSSAELAVEFHTAVPDALFRYQLGAVESVTNVTELIAMSTIDVNSLGLSDMRGIEYSASLTSVIAHTNSIPEIRIETLLLLTYVHLYGNQLTNINISLLTGLTYLNLSQNLIAQTEMEGIVENLYTNRFALGANSCIINLSSNPGSAAAAVTKAALILAIESNGSTVTI